MLDKKIIEKSLDKINKIDKYKIVTKKGDTKIDIDNYIIEEDSIKWYLEKNLEEKIDELNKKQISLQEKILLLYEYICLNYIYDMNVLYFFKKDISNPEDIKYIACDWYGRLIDDEWYNNRQNHNKRICYEFARFFASGINTLLKYHKIYDLEAIVYGLIDNTHYITGLIGQNINILFDMDDFNSIKDLTRLKHGLSIKGIKILEDDKLNFLDYIKKYNEDKGEELETIVKLRNKKDEYENKIKYLESFADLLVQENFDVQGFSEYMKIEIESFGIDTNKLWKKISNGNSFIYEKCLYFNIDDIIYLEDPTIKKIYKINLDDLDENVFVIDPQKHLYEYNGK